jgi:23S rRNA (uracil747-C5)-methyltransferase
MNNLCDYFQRKECQSCNLMPLGHIQAAKQKEQAVLKSLQIVDPKVSLIPIEILSNPFYSRTKAKIAISGSVEDPCIGFFNASESIQSLEECPLHVPIINAFLLFFKNQVIKENLAPYNLKTQKGEVKGLVIASNQAQIQVSVRIILRSRALEEKFKKIKNNFFSNFPELKVLALSIQPIHQASLDGEYEIFLSEEKFIWEEYNSIKVALSPTSFFQVTPFIASRLYQTANEWLTLTETNSILELYCGAGAFSLITASHSKKSLGIDITEDAIKAAGLSAQANKIPHLTFKTLDLEAHDPMSDFDFDTCIVNPPRRGLSKNIIDFLTLKKPKMLLYSSCNPESLVNNLMSLTSDYVIEKAQCFDMFPLTSHVETLCLLKLRQ